MLIKERKVTEKYFKDCDKNNHIYCSGWKNTVINGISQTSGFMFVVEFKTKKEI